MSDFHLKPFTLGERESESVNEHDHGFGERFSPQLLYVLLSGDMERIVNLTYVKTQYETNDERFRMVEPYCGQLGCKMNTGRFDMGAITLTLNTYVE
ncbi:hypothetical protein EVAR_37879_1 [Eumeta japonica]|uniref:Uncharacterized protein n=1 Tax=Eumeta variegata TaxID=151549 RepID=A0A4C1Y8X7_EUMVA|nr:hypothetical protein EVAR_37879_1 [Eumeta japonica]